MPLTLFNPWVILGIVVAIAGVYLKGRLDGNAAQENAYMRQTLVAQQKADALANELIIAQAASMAANEKTILVYRDKVTHAPSTSTCGPVLRDAARGVCAAFAGQPDAKCGAVAPVH